MAGSQLLFASRSVPRPATEPLRVTIAGENPLRRAALVMRLAVFGDLALNEVAYVDDIRNTDVVVADTIDASRSSAPVLYLVKDGSEASQAVARGARGVMLRSAPPRRLHSGIRAVADGFVIVDDEVAEAVLPRARARVDLIEPLTPREQQVAQLLAGGLTNKEIAQRLAITEHTVKFHLNGILRKLGVSTRTEAVVQAARLGLLVL
ncbi:MAG TPA: response regulator transcription factor [Thermoanaerobaculia bacterium]|nr:response regulator transcription factor [Thermoanaerobaculia bacterium]